MPGIDGLSGDKGDKVRMIFFVVVDEFSQGFAALVQMSMFSSVSFFVNRVKRGGLVIQDCQV